MILLIALVSLLFGLVATYFIMFGFKIPKPEMPVSWRKENKYIIVTTDQGKAYRTTHGICWHDANGYFVMNDEYLRAYLKRLEFNGELDDD